MTQGDVLPRLTSIFMQQMTGTDRQSLAHNRYAQIGEGDFNTPWNNSYAGGLYDLKLIEEKAEAAGASAYVGVAKNHDSYVFRCFDRSLVIFLTLMHCKVRIT